MLSICFLHELIKYKTHIVFTGKSSRNKEGYDRRFQCSNSSSGDSSISTYDLQCIIDKLKTERVRSSTKRNYYSVWKSFNKFFIKLDNKPDCWEDRLTLFIGYLIQCNKTSQTCKSYISAIKNVLADDGITLNEDRLLLSSLTKACRYKNDTVRQRFPINRNMLCLILKQVSEHFSDQLYLSVLYKALFSTAYHGLFRVSELTAGEHAVMVKDVHIAKNKLKLLFILRSSKTHGLYTTPQMVKITGKQNASKKQDIKGALSLPCPWKLLKEYLALRPGYKEQTEAFFVFRDHSPVSPNNMRSVLKIILKECRFNETVYDTHSFRIGKATDLLRIHKYSVETIKKIGRWSSNCVFKYLR